MTRKTRFSFLLCILLAASETVSATGEQPRNRVAVILKDSLVDSTLADALARALWRERLESTFLLAEQVCDPSVLSPDRFFLYVIPHVKEYPPAGAEALVRYWRGRGNLLVLGTPSLPGNR